jgi:redox-regulated HSP33 family molecular chaperone
MMGEDDRDYLRGDSGELEAECVFCGTTYRFEPGELAAGG